MLQDCDLPCVFIVCFSFFMGWKLHESRGETAQPFTVVFIAATGTWDIVGVQYLNDGIEDCIQM